MLPNFLQAGIGLRKMHGFKVLLAYLSSENYERAERIYRTGSRMYGLLRKTAPKANLACAFVDAGMSLVDLVSSYCKYQQAVEKTKQLEIKIDAFRKEIENIKKILEMEEEEAIKERALESEVQFCRLKTEIQALRRIGNLLQDNIANLLQDFRARGIGSKETHRQLEKQFFDTTLRYLQLLESVV